MSRRVCTWILFAFPGMMFIARGDEVARGQDKNHLVVMGLGCAEIFESRQIMFWSLELRPAWNACGFYPCFHGK